MLRKVDCHPILLGLSSVHSLPGWVLSVRTLHAYWFVQRKYTMRLLKPAWVTHKDGTNCRLFLTLQLWNFEVEMFTCFSSKWFMKASSLLSMCTFCWHHLYSGKCPHACRLKFNSITLPLHLPVSLLFVKMWSWYWIKTA